MPETHNSQKTVAVVWLIIAGLALAGIFMPSLLGMDMMRFGYGLGLINLLIAITGAIVALIYFKRAATLDRLLRGDELIVHWQYAPEEWSRYSEVELGLETSEKRGLFFLIAGIALLIGLIFFLLLPDGGLAVLLTLLGLILLIGVVAFGVPRINYARNQRAVGQAFIGRSAVYLGGVLHTWNTLGARLEGVQVREGDPPLLAIGYSFPTRTGRQTEVVRVPVPRGEEQAAHHVAQTLQNG
ncbi:MAG: hypothetical protein JW934_22805 [Anaerolineae bacterium]|nr:hypothetical protein [Anaerolineae bacterium]